MSEPIGVGDWIECVDAGRRPCSGPFDPIIVLGGIYRVHALVPGCELRSGNDSVELIEDDRLDSSGRRFCYAADRFRPIYRKRDADKLIETLKAPPVKAPNTEPVG